MRDLCTELKMNDTVGIIGGGLCGIELANQISGMGKRVYMIEQKDTLAGQYYDQDICLEIRKELEKKGVLCKCGSPVTGFEEKDDMTVAYVKSEETIHAGFWILANGYQPNDALARACGIMTASEGGILAEDYYGRTNLQDIYAIGGCAAKKAMLSSMAAVEGILAALYAGSSETRKKVPAIGSYMLRINDHIFGVAGMTEGRASESGIDIVTGTADEPDRHPFFVFSETQAIKLIADKKNGRIIGGEIQGGISAGELINVITGIIQNKK